MCLYLFEMKQMPRKNNDGLFRLALVNSIWYDAKWNVNLDNTGGLSGKRAGWHMSGDAEVKSTGLTGKKQKAKHLPSLKSMQKGSKPLLDKRENTVQLQWREKEAAQQGVKGLKCLCPSCLQGCVCAGRMSWAFGRVNKKYCVL